MKNIVLFICIAVTALMVILHIALFFGAPLGEFLMGGNHRVLPPKMRIFNIVYGTLFSWFIVVYLGKTSYVSIPITGTISFISMLIYTAFLGYAILGNMFLTQSKKENLEYLLQN